MFHRPLALVALCALLLSSLVGCGSPKAPDDDAAGASAAVAPTIPPVPEASARAFVERFVSAMNSKDNLQLVRMVKPGGTFLMKTQAGDRKMTSKEFLAFFQDGLRAVGSTYGAEIRSMKWTAEPGAAAVLTELEESIGIGSWSQRSTTKLIFHVEDVDGSLRCARIEGAP